MAENGHKHVRNGFSKVDKAGAIVWASAYLRRSRSFHSSIHANLEVTTLCTTNRVSGDEG